MSRRNISKKRFPKADPTYNSYLVSLLVTRILKAGKKNLAQNIVNGAFDITMKVGYVGQGLYKIGNIVINICQFNGSIQSVVL